MSRLERIAYEESLKTGDTKQFFGCLILRHKRILSKGHNFRAHSYKTYDLLSCCCHAEMDAIYRHLCLIGRWRDFYRVLKLSYRYTGVMNEMSPSLFPFLQKLPRPKRREKFKMYVFRFYASGGLANSKPCAECTRWVYLAATVGVEYDIYYTTDEETLSKFTGDSNTYSPISTYF